MTYEIHVNNSPMGLRYSSLSKALEVREWLERHIPRNMYEVRGKKETDQ